MKTTWLVLLLVVLVGLSIWVNLANRPERRKAPPAMTAEQILAVPESQVFSLVTHDLRWRLAELDPSDFGKWRTLPAAARHVFALAWVERDDGPGTPPVFTGFASIVGNSAANVPTLAEISEAYTAIGASAPAAVVSQAEQIATASGLARGDAPGNDPFPTLNQQLLSASSKAGVIRLLRTYIRDNAEVIATATFGS